MVSEEMHADPDGEATVRMACHVATSHDVESQPRQIIEEVPVRIVVDGDPVATLMHTPGSETELAMGFLLSEGIICSPHSVGAISFCRDGSLGESGEVLVRLADGTARKRGYRDIMSSCSLCGDAWMETYAEGIPPFTRGKVRLCVGDVLSLSEAMSEAQEIFRRTGAAHSAVIGELPVDASAGRFAVREDLGRHNALDKALGAAVNMGLDPARCLLLLSSRLSFEMVVKAARAGIGNVAGISAPSAAAVRLANQVNMFLAGFVRGEKMTIYAGLDALQRPIGGAP
jgi:FdhD protein